jgi:hypothetical protein
MLLIDGKITRSRQARYYNDELFAVKTGRS